MIGMTRERWPNLILLYYINREDKLVRTSVMDIEKEKKRLKSDEITLIMLITVFILFFFTHNLTVFLVLLMSGLIIGIFGLIKDYKKR
jgi:hypothetical protein